MSKKVKKGGPKPANMMKTLGRLFSYLMKYKFSLLLVLLFILVSAFALISSSYFLKPIVNDYIIPGDFSGLAKMLGVLIVIYIAGALSSFGYSRIMIHVAQRTVKDIRNDLFSKMQKMPVSYFDWNPNGDLMSLYTNDVDNLSETLNSSLTNIFSSTITFIGIIVMMIVLNPLLILVTIVFLLIMVGVIKNIGSKSKRYFGEQQKEIGALNGYIEEMIEGQKVIKVFCHEDKAIEDFKKYNEQLREASTNAQNHAGRMMPSLGNISYANYAVTCCVGALMTIGGIFNIGALVAYLQYTRQITQPIQQVSQQVNMLLAALAGAERIFKVLDDEPNEIDNGTITLSNVEVVENQTDVDTGADTEDLFETDRHTGKFAWNNNGKLTPLTGDVVFKDVVFGYYPEKTILKNISLHAYKGQKIAFVGSTGAGKTTITNLINRFYEINSGSITYDGIDIKDIKKDDLRRSLGIVLQDTHLFTGTIEENIRYGNLNATKEQIIAAAKLANADTFIKHLPHGYDTVITGDGEGLSQGQRQLLAIARAAVANPPVLILDEATSSIDTRTEKIITQAMDKLMHGRTVFVIAHRLSTIKNSDAIMVLEQGQIIERGNHDELLAKKGRYYELYTGKVKNI
ncbi:ABC transporter ATP-binding protein [Clostridium sp. SM-530-WT-3G]|uniref:ABC transporter ATP-binding protein n=1 Tax=Clostridium sp. SM-530-WT-3G TaxID=2725303 RepID=UPI00145E0E9E|nr:ABC transporter ATP-binding protein [Clostridium sp. SM-530-WT-3G]NME83614.1 ABC transporter ATP-binding protein [Clostridium sp. SM-530-WT-3G]